jgi:hypothetical protein
MTSEVVENTGESSFGEAQVRRMTSEVVENTDESSFGKDRQMLELKTLIQRLP